MSADAIDPFAERPCDVAQVTGDDIRALVNASLDMLTLLDDHGMPIFVSSASTWLTGYEPDELVGRSGLLLVHPDDRAATQACLERLLVGESVRKSYRILHKAGHAIWVESLGRPTAAGDRHVIVTRDISVQMRREEQLRFDALHDSLTGLANRQFAVEEITAAVARAQRSGRAVALLFIDIDRFKSVNDTLGHSCGDEVLKAVALRLRGAVRRGDLVARLGGDEFIVLMENLPRRPKHAMAAASAKLRAILAEPHTVNGMAVTASGSVGAALWEDGQDADELLRAADRMMYLAKTATANPYPAHPGLAVPLPKAPDEDDQNLRAHGRRGSERT